MSVIQINDVSYSYDKDLILDNINLKVEEKDFLAIIGPNGGGKSTLLKLILGLIKPQKGSITVLDKAPSKSLSHIGSKHQHQYRLSHQGH